MLSSFKVPDNVVDEDSRFACESAKFRIAEPFEDLVQTMPGLDNIAGGSDCTIHWVAQSSKANQRALRLAGSSWEL